MANNSMNIQKMFKTVVAKFNLKSSKTGLPYHGLSFFFVRLSCSIKRWTLYRKHRGRICFQKDSFSYTPLSENINFSRIY